MVSEGSWTETAVVHRLMLCGVRFGRRVYVPSQRGFQNGRGRPALRFLFPSFCEYATLIFFSCPSLWNQNPSSDSTTKKPAYTYKTHLELFEKKKKILDRNHRGGSGFVEKNIEQTRWNDERAFFFCCYKKTEGVFTTSRPLLSSPPLPCLPPKTNQEKTQDCVSNWCMLSQRCLS